MAEIKCCGDCRKCDLLKRGETDPARCASVWGFIHVTEMYREMKDFRDEIKSLIQPLIEASGGGNITNLEVPGLLDNFDDDNQGSSSQEPNSDQAQFENYEGEEEIPIE